MKDDFYIGSWRVEPRRLTLGNDRKSATVKPKSMAVLVELARAKGEVVSRRDLIDRVWGASNVSDDVLTQSIAELRRAMDDDAQAPRYIETIKRVGVRLIPEAVRTETSPTDRKAFWRTPATVIAVAGLVVLGFLWLTQPEPLAAERSIAVLPFTNMTPDKSNQYFGDGLAEEITNALAQVEGLRVVARTSAFAFRDREVDVREIGEQLNVAHVLESSIRRSGNRVRITTQLIDTADGYHRWSRSYDYELGDSFKIQQAVASDLASALALDFGIALPLTTTSGIAYDMFLAGKQHMRAGRYNRARQLFEQAVFEDPDYALAYANLAISLTVFHENATAVRQPGEASDSWLEQAEAAVQQAIRVQYRHEDVHIARASIAAARREYGAEAAALAQAIALNPASVEARIRLSRNLAARGQYTEALAELEAISARDPLNPELAVWRAALVAAFDGYDTASGGLLRLTELGIDSPQIWDALTELAAEYGRYVDRVYYARQLVRTAPDRAWSRAQLGDAYMELGEFELADGWITAAEKISRLEALKARVRWLGANRDFESFSRLVAAAMKDQEVDLESEWMSPAQSAVAGLYGLSLGFSGQHEEAAKVEQRVLEMSSTLPRRSPYMPIFVRSIIASQYAQAGDADSFARALVDLQQSIDDVVSQGITDHPWITLLQASAYAMAGDDTNARRTFQAAIEQGWRAWTLEQLGVASPLTGQREIVRELEADLDRMRLEVGRRGLAQPVSDMENID